MVTLSTFSFSVSFYDAFKTLKDDNTGFKAITGSKGSATEQYFRAALEVVECGIATR